eukprot:3436-Heterococcus_DN1.PRE.1
MDFMNYAQTPLVSLAVQFNKNYFGLSPAQPQIMLSAPVAIGGTASHTWTCTPAQAAVLAFAYSTVKLCDIVCATFCTPIACCVSPCASTARLSLTRVHVTSLLQMALNPAMLAPAGAVPAQAIQCAVKNMTTSAVLYFSTCVGNAVGAHNRSVPIETSNVLSSDGQIDRGTFLGYWKAVNDSLEVYSVINDAPQLDLKCLQAAFVAICGTAVLQQRRKLAARNIFYIAQRDVAGPTPSQIKLCVRTEAQPFAQQATALVESVLRA